MREATISVMRADFRQPNDRDALSIVLTEYAAALGDSLAAPVEVILDGLRDAENSLAWIAWWDRVPAGLAICFQTFSTFDGRPVLNLHDLAVRAQYRGRGLGSRLLEVVIDEARTRGCSKVTLEVRDDLPEASELYRRWGFGDPGGRPTRFLSRSITSNHQPR